MPLPGMDAIVVLQRAYDPVNGNPRQYGDHPDNPRDAAGKSAASPRPPLTRDNLEGVFAVARRTARCGSMLSDDSFNPGQRRLLMAFDTNRRRDGA